MSDAWNYDQWFASPDGMKAVKSLGERHGLDLNEINDPAMLARVVVNAVPQSALWLPKSLIDEDAERDARQLLGQLAGDYPDENEMCGWLAMLKHGVAEVMVPYYGGTDQIDLADDFQFTMMHGGAADGDALRNDFKQASGLDLEDYFWKNLDDSGAGDGNTYSCNWITVLSPEFSQHTTDPEWDEPWEDEENDKVDDELRFETPLGEQLDENQIDD